mgnify:CR=1 FL=1
MDVLVEQLARFFRAHASGKNILLAYSGGMDSHVLLHLLADLRKTFSFQLRAMYINHGIHVDADHWAKHCANVCQKLEVEFIQQSIVQFADRDNLEEKLRVARYQLFKNTLVENELLFTAHHQDDQAETILLQLCRGAGLSGLAAMPRIKQFGRGFHARPLLDVTRENLLNYATDHHLNWIDDESNFDSRYARNFLRHEVMPILAKRWPSITKTFARSAENCADAKKCLDASLEHFLQEVQGSTKETLSVKKVAMLELTQQRHLLRKWIQQAGFLLPSAIKMQQIQRTLLLAREDKNPCVDWGNVEMRRYRDDLFLMEKLLPHDPQLKMEWNLLQPLRLLGNDLLHTSIVPGKKLRQDIQTVTVQVRQGGEMIRLPGRKHHHELKKLFQEWGVLPWLRDRIPLIYVEGVLAAVVGFWIAEEFAADHQFC